MAGTALVTGATSGIGAAFARLLAAQGYGLVLVARDEQRLDSTVADLAERHGVAAVGLPADLSTEAGIAAVADRLREPAVPIDLLVNNAGTTQRRSLLRTPPEELDRMLRLNVEAVLRLTVTAVRGMVDRRHGAVVNVSSVAGFGVAMPGSTYAASKAWVTNFSQSAALAARPYGVRVMALCPGYTRTELHDRAGIDMSWLPRRLWLDADEVARVGLRDLARGRMVSVPDWRYKIAAFGLRHAPSGLARSVSRDSRSRTERPGS